MKSTSCNGKVIKCPDRVAWCWFPNINCCYKGSCSSVFRLLEAFIKTINSAIAQHITNAKHSKMIIKFRWRPSRKQIIVEVRDGYQDWAWFSKMVRERPIINSFPWPKNSPGSWSICFLVSFFESHLPSTVYQLHILTCPPRSDQHF